MVRPFFCLQVFKLNIGELKFAKFKPNKQSPRLLSARYKHKKIV